MDYAKILAQIKSMKAPTAAGKWLMNRLKDNIPSLDGRVKAQFVDLQLAVKRRDLNNIAAAAATIIDLMATEGDMDVALVLTEMAQVKTSAERIRVWSIMIGSWVIQGLIAGFWVEGLALILGS